MNLAATISQAWPLSKRRSDTVREIERAASENRLPLIKPGHFADTYKGMTKAEVREEIRKRNELAGEGK
jgi:hypothetical protein